MIFIKNTGLLALVLLVAGCGGNFVKQELDDSHQLAVKEDPEYGTPVLSFHDGMLFDFSSLSSGWWTANDKVRVDRTGDTMRVQLNECGRDYECWGKEIELLDFTDAPVLKVTVKAEGDMTPVLGISLKDVDGYDTNADRPSERIMPGVGYVDYYFNFQGKWRQGWPDNQKVKQDMIREILFFVNPGGPLNWTGTLYIDDIEAVPLSAVPSDEELKERRRSLRRAKRARERGEAVQEPEKTSQTINTPEEASPVVITEFTSGIDDWSVSEDDKISLSEENDQLYARLSGVGEAYENFSMRFDAVNFAKTPILHVRVKAEGDESPNSLRVDIEDVQDFETNAFPNVKKVNFGTDFVDLYYDFTGKFEQEFPNMKKVDPENIIGVRLYVNPGGPDYTGTIVLDKIRAISVEDYKNLK